MGLIRRLGSGVAKNKADSTEGLIINIGVVNALILAFSLPLMVSVDMEVFDRLDFQCNLFEDMEFRKFAIFVMDQKDMGAYKPEAFSWNVVTGVNTTVNVKTILLQSPTVRAGRIRVGDDYQKNLKIASEALTVKFPMWQMRIWRGAQQSGQFWGSSDSFFLMSSLSTALLLAGIVVAMFLYVSFTLSPTHEEGNTGLAEWNRFGIPVVLLLYVMNVFAIVFFLVGLTILVAAYVPRLSQAVFVREVAMFGITIPFVGVGLLLAIVLTLKSCKAGELLERTSPV